MRDEFYEARELRANWDIEPVQVLEGRFRADYRGPRGPQDQLMLAPDAVNEWVEQHANDATVEAFVRCRGSGLDVIARASWLGRASCDYECTFTEWQARSGLKAGR